MATLTIRNIKPTVKERLRVRAAAHGHSMEAEARRIPQTALTKKPSGTASLSISTRGSRPWAVPIWNGRRANPLGIHPPSVDAIFDTNVLSALMRLRPELDVREWIGGRISNRLSRDIPPVRNSDMKRDDVLVTLREHESELRSAGVVRLSLFGSTARDEAGPDSDVDLLAAFDAARPLSLLDLIGIENRLADLLGRPVDLIEEGTLKPRFRLTASRDAVRAF